MVRHALALNHPPRSGGKEIMLLRSFPINEYNRVSQRGNTLVTNTAESEWRPVMGSFDGNGTHRRDAGRRL